MRTAEPADLAFLRNTELLVKGDYFVDLSVDKTARRHYNPIVISHLDHERAGRNQRRQIEVVEVSEHSEIVLVDDVRIKRVRRALRQVQLSSRSSR